MLQALLAVVFVLLLALWIQSLRIQSARRKLNREHSERLAAITKERDERVAELTKSRDAFEAEARSLRPFSEVRDTAAEAARIAADAKAQIEAATVEAARIRDEAAADAEKHRQESLADAREKRDKSEALLSGASRQVAAMLEEARTRAEQIGGDAYRALEKAEELRRTVRAMENVIEGYGDRYIKPTHSLLDELAEAYGFDDAGAQLKQARELSRLMVGEGRAAACDYVERERRETAIRFVVDAFNGKADSIASRVKVDNYGTLCQEIEDAFALVNMNGAAFRNARITREYADARIAELKWAAAVYALREKEKEEQRRIKEQIREEERARREIEKALRESAKEEETLHRAMEKVQAQVAKASEEQRAQFELKLAELQARLAEAEAKNQKALSMAQQTKAGHVYVISNIGSFGEDVFKVGMTRRLEPLDRIRELGDASVPFPFDVHAMIWSDDAPQLETRLHHALLKSQVNKVNPRKEFFRVDFAALRAEIDGSGEKVSWTVAAAAMEYRETLAIEEKLRLGTVEAEQWERQQLDYEATSSAPVEPEPADAS